MVVAREESEIKAQGEPNEARGVEVEARPEGAGLARSGRSGGPRERTCVGCGERVDVASARGIGAELVRLILGPEGEVAVDAGGGGFGRGAYVHPRRDCLVKAVQRGLPKAAKGRVSTLRTGGEGDGSAGLEGESEGGRTKLTVEALAGAVKDAMNRRIRGLLTSAGRARSLALGADAVTGACERGEAAVVVVACDAAAGAELPAVRKAITEGRAVAWGTKRELAELCGGGSSRKQEAGLAIVAVTSRGSIAAALRDAVHAADACEVGSAGAHQGKETEAAGSGGSSRRGSDRGSRKKTSTTGIAARAAVNRPADR